MADLKLKPSSASQILTTELNSLANGSRVITAAIDNTSALDLWDDLELLVTFGVAPTAGLVCVLYMLISVDGTNYADGDASIAPPLTALVGSFPPRAVTSAQRIAVRGIQLPPLKFKYVLANSAGQTMAASGNILTRVPYKEQVV